MWNWQVSQENGCVRLYATGEQRFRTGRGDSGNYWVYISNINNAQYEIDVLEVSSSARSGTNTGVAYYCNMNNSTNAKSVGTIYTILTWGQGRLGNVNKPVSDFLVIHTNYYTQIYVFVNSIEIKLYNVKKKEN